MIWTNLVMQSLQHFRAQIPREMLEYLKIRPVALACYGSIAHVA